MFNVFCGSGRVLSSLRLQPDHSDVSLSEEISYKLEECSLQDVGEGKMILVCSCIMGNVGSWSLTHTRD